MPFGGCPGTRAEVGQPLQQSVGISTHYRDTEGAPHLAHDFAQLDRPSLPALDAAGSSHPGLCEDSEELVEVRGQVTP